MAIGPNDLRILAATNYPDNSSRDISAKDLRDGMYLVADILDALDVQEAIDDLQSYVEAAEGFAGAAQQDAQRTAEDLAAVITAVTDMTGGSVGQVLVKASGTDYDYSWATVDNTGDMMSVIFDPNGIEGDAFTMDNMVEGEDTKIMTSAEREKLENLSKDNVGLSNVDNTSDADKPVSTATQTALDGKASTDAATISKDGLMTSTDKIKLNAVGTMANRSFTFGTGNPSGGSNGDIYFKVV